MTLVLVADDEPSMVKLLMYNLRASGYQVISAANGAAAVPRVKDDNPYLVILEPQYARDGWFPGVRLDSSCFGCGDHSCQCASD
jgi:DNA-binding response OmpR family regulator